ncbi:uncharacterized protein LOC129592822 [Paramacrobiotus metropolitanus]|uniref:uncharacterized protein LOC129592822 n=1 Tax=Paramacrobiotus metropolitanus TaxID=2943436 RepID=UPI0024461050|nr:uncharacterized protein LOC129592822 [Paramacrobiotus metropolitanus]
MSNFLVIAAVVLLASCVQGNFACSAQKNGKPIVVMLAFCVQNSFGCSTKTNGRPVDRMNQLLNEAKQLNDKGIMHLHGYGSGPSTRNYPISEWPPHTEIIRAPEGGTLFVPCSNANKKQVSHIAIPPAFTYNGEHFTIKNAEITRESSEEMKFCCNCTKEICTGEHLGSRLRVSGYDPATGAFSIALERFTYAHTGLYECLHSNGSQLVVTRRYWVTPRHIRYHVFDPPMQNVTVRYGDPAKIVCPVRFNYLPGDLTARFLWRKGRYLLLVKSIPQVKDSARSPYGFSGHFEFDRGERCGCNSIMKINNVTREHAGVYECWFRINDRLDEWIMQEAHLLVI